MENTFKNEMCSYGCGSPGIYMMKNGKLCCSDYHTKCPALRKKNSNGQKDNGGIWNKGLTKETDDRVLKYSLSGSKTKKRNYSEGKRVWNLGLTKYTDTRVKDQGISFSKNQKGYYATKQYFIDKFGEIQGLIEYKETGKKKSQSLENKIKSILSLPIHPYITKKEIEYICAAITNFYKI